MARIRSPNYPSISLTDAIGRVGQLFERERQHWATKEVAIKGMGYGSINGASLSAISAAEKYGLVERDKKNNYRVTPRAIAILHPHSQDEKLDALADAIRAPALFSELLKEFEFPLPSDDNLRAYLVRRGFSEVSLPSVIQAFRDTMALVSPESASPTSADASKPTETERKMRPNTPLGAVSVGPRIPIPGAQFYTPPSSPLVVSFNGEQVEVFATLESGEEIDRLILALQANKPLLPAKRPKADAEETDKKAE